MNFTIEQARKLSGFTQREMAEKMGIHRQTYIKIEKNPEKATVEQGRQIAAITGVRFEQIFFG